MKSYHINYADVTSNESRWLSVRTVLLYLNLTIHSGYKFNRKSCCYCKLYYTVYSIHRRWYDWKKKFSLYINIKFCRLSAFFNGTTIDRFKAKCEYFCDKPTNWHLVFLRINNEAAVIFWILNDFQVKVFILKITI